MLSGHTIRGVMKLGGDYSNISEYPGAWPVHVLRRIHILFPELAACTEDNLLHMFAGSLSLRDGRGKEIQKEYRIVGTTLDACTTKGWEHMLRPDIFAKAQSFTGELAWQAYLAKRGEAGDAVFEYILSDTPFNDRQADAKYNCKLPPRGAVLEQARAVLRPGGLIIWQDEMEPLHAAERWNHVLDVVLDLGQGKYLRKLTGLEKRP